MNTFPQEEVLHDCTICNKINCCKCYFQQYSLDNKCFKQHENKCESIFFNKGDVINQNLTGTLKVCYIRSGLVKVEAQSSGNQSQILKLLKSGSFIGLNYLFSNEEEELTATILEDTKMCLIDTNCFREYLKDNSAFMLELMQTFYKQKMYFVEKFVGISQKQMHGLVADSLLYLSDHVYCTDKFEISLTKEELGNMAGLSRESYSRIINQFKKDRIIDMSGKLIHIVDKSTLLSISKYG
jgi:CRP-like cAMP-binding protein